MENDKHVIWIWSNARSIPPHQLRIYPMQFIFPFFVVMFIVSLFLFSLILWLCLSGLSLPLPQLVGATIKILAWKLTGGLAWSVKASALLTAIAGHTAVPLSIIALPSFACGAFAGWNISKLQLTPRDGYQHIRGPQLYEGEEALERLKKYMKSSSKGSRK